MSPWLIGIVSLCYWYVGIEHGFKGEWGWFGFWMSYGTANIGWLKATGVI